MALDRTSASPGTKQILPQKTQVSVWVSQQAECYYQSSMDRTTWNIRDHPQA